MPNIEDARPACRGANVELIQWDPEFPETLQKVFEGCTASLLVPPIHNRLIVAAKYIQMAKQNGVRFLVNIGVQFDDKRVNIAQEADSVI